MSSISSDATSAKPIASVDHRLSEAAASTHIPQKLRLRRAEAAAYLTAKGLPTALATLNKLASIGGGPEMEYWGRIPTYTPIALDNWAIKRLSKPVNSTAHRGA